MDPKACAPWLVPLKPEDGQTRLHLIAIPYAGGSAAVFRKWSRWLPPSIALYGLELPGRGRRLKEPRLTSMPELVARAAAAIQPVLSDRFALFGHSLGATIAFELGYFLQEQGRSGLAHVVVSGQRALHCPSPLPPISHLPANEFISEILKFGGTPPALFDSRELRDLLVPMLRADFTLLETFRPGRHQVLNCPLTAYGGLHDDDVSLDDVRAWERYTRGAFQSRVFPGNHFFLQSHDELLVPSLAADLGMVFP